MFYRYFSLLNFVWVHVVRQTILELFVVGNKTRSIIPFMSLMYTQRHAEYPFLDFGRHEGTPVKTLTTLDSMGALTLATSRLLKCCSSLRHLINDCCINALITITYKTRKFSPVLLLWRLKLGIVSKWSCQYF